MDSDSMYDRLMDDYDQTETVQDSIPTGWYPMVFTKLYGRAVSDSGVPRVRYGVRIIDGEHADRVVFVGINMGVRATDANGNPRNSEELTSKMQQVGIVLKKFMNALQLTPNQMVQRGTPESVFDFYRVDNWVERPFRGRLVYREATDKYEESYEIRDCDTIDSTRGVKRS